MQAPKRGRKMSGHERRMSINLKSLTCMKGGNLKSVETKWHRLRRMKAIVSLVRKSSTDDHRLWITLGGSGLQTMEHVFGPERLILHGYSIYSIRCFCSSYKILYIFLWFFFVCYIFQSSSDDPNKSWREFCQMYVLSLLPISIKAFFLLDAVFCGGFGSW